MTIRHYFAVLKYVDHNSLTYEFTPDDILRLDWGEFIISIDGQRILISKYAEDNSGWSVGEDLQDYCVTALFHKYKKAFAENGTPPKYIWHIS
jgi:hypothetical protein